jgi:hypothetical protein
VDEDVNGCGNVSENGRGNVLVHGSEDVNHQAK